MAPSVGQDSTPRDRVGEFRVEALSDNDVQVSENGHNSKRKSQTSRNHQNVDSELETENLTSNEEFDETEDSQRLGKLLPLSTSASNDDQAVYRKTKSHKL